MRKFLLPTAEIVQEFQSLDPLFCFYQEGIRGLVRDCLKLGTGQPITEDLTEAFVDFVVEEYEQSLHLRYVENTLRHAPSELVIGMIVTQVEDAVQKMMQLYLRNTLYNVRRADAWLGDDLIVSMEFLGNDYDTKEFDTRLLKRNRRF